MGWDLKREPEYGDDFGVFETEHSGVIRHTFEGVQSLCPFEDYSDNYDITLRYNVDGYVFEISTFRKWLDSAFREREISHIDLAAEVLEVFDENMPDYDGVSIEVEPKKYRGTGSKVMMTEEDL